MCFSILAVDYSLEDSTVVKWMVALNQKRLTKWTFAYFGRNLVFVPFL